MTREQLLESLKEMAEMINNDDKYLKANEYNEKEQAEIENQVELLKYQIRDLEARLEDDENYRSFNFIRNHSKIYDYEAKLRKIPEEVARIEADVLSKKSRLNVVNSEILGFPSA